MRAEIVLQEDTTTLFLRWEIILEGGEQRRCEALGGPLALKLGATNYVDNGGKFFAQTEVEVPVFPHAGTRNFGQAKFTRYDSRRAFVEHLQQGITIDAATFVADARPGSVPVEGRELVRGLPLPTPA